MEQIGFKLSFHHSSYITYDSNSKMVTIEDSRQYQIKNMASAEENIPTSRETASLSLNERRNTHTRMRSNFYCRRQRCCVSSKAALLILVWNLILIAGFKYFLDPNYFRVLFVNNDGLYIVSVIMYSVVAFLFLFYPLAGCLADIRWGRYTKLLSIVCVLSGGV